MTYGDAGAAYKAPPPKEGMKKDGPVGTEAAAAAGSSIHQSVTGSTSVQGQGVAGRNAPGADAVKPGAGDVKPGKEDVQSKDVPKDEAPKQGAEASLPYQLFRSTCTP